MNSTNQERLFPTESAFVFWLAKLMEAHPNFENVAIEPRLNLPRAGERLAIADLIAVEKVASSERTIIIECKNFPTLFGNWPAQAVEQILRYGSYKPSSRLVLAFPGNASPEAAERIKAVGIDVWDLATIQAIFSKQIPGTTPPEVLTNPAFNLASKRIEDELIQALKDCVPGRPQWSIYQKLIGQILEHLFCPPLQRPLGESGDESGANRRDYVLANFAEEGFWRYLRDRYDADYIVVDAKNFVSPVKKKEVLQIANYLKPFGAGMFAMIFTRAGGDASARLTVREQWFHYHKLILILTDKHVEEMLRGAIAGSPTLVLQNVLQEFRLSM